MRSVFLLFGFLLIHNVSFGQGDSILDFFDNIFNISSYIENENKERLQRELKYFAQTTDELIEIKKTTTTEMLAHCNGSANSESAIENQMRQFNKKVKQASRNLENIRENVMFESDYDIIVDTIFTAVEYDSTIHFELEPGCFLKSDTTYLTDDFAPEGFNPMTQMDMPVSTSVVSDSVVVVNMYCPQRREQKRTKHGWKAISFSELVEGFQYSLNTKSRNIDFLFQNCDRKLIIQERKKAVGALKAMRDKALELKKNIKLD